MVRTMQHATSSSPGPQSSTRVSPASAAAAQRLAQQRPPKQATPLSAAAGVNSSSAPQRNSAQGSTSGDSDGNVAARADATQLQPALQQPQSSNSNTSAKGSAGTHAAQEEPAGVTVLKNGNPSSDSNGSAAGVGGGQRQVDPDLQLQVLVAWKAVDWTAGAAEADTAAVDMRPENVQAWFTKVSCQFLGQYLVAVPCCWLATSARPQPGTAALQFWLCIYVLQLQWSDIFLRSDAFPVSCSGWPSADAEQILLICAHRWYHYAALTTRPLATALVPNCCMQPGLVGLAEAAATSTPAGAAGGGPNGAISTPPTISTPNSQNNSDPALQPAANTAASLTGDFWLAFFISRDIRKWLA
jgi:hypothetical protein